MLLPFWVFLVWGGWRLKLNRHLSNWGTPGWQILLWGLRFFLQVIDNCPAQVLLPKTHFMLFSEGSPWSVIILIIYSFIHEFRIVQNTYINSNYFRNTVFVLTYHVKKKKEKKKLPNGTAQLSLLSIIKWLYKIINTFWICETSEKRMKRRS